MSVAVTPQQGGLSTENGDQHRRMKLDTMQRETDSREPRLGEYTYTTAMAQGTLQTGQKDC